MHRRKRWYLFVALIMGAATTAQASVPVAKVKDRYPKSAEAYAAMVDGELLWGRNLDTHRSPASLTKLLTALVVLDSPEWSPDTVLDVSRQAATIQRTRVGLKSGDSVRAGDALLAMLVHSANDACMVLAEHYARDLPTFVARMNARAAQMGLANSHFAQPCGLDAAGQYSTARDLLVLAQTAHADPRIATIVSTEEATISTAAGRELTFRNTNHLLGVMDGVVGLKTGFTASAGRCVIVVAQQDGHKAYVVLLNSRQRWGAARRMLTDAFASAQRTQLASRSSVSGGSSAPAGRSAITAAAGAGLVNVDASKTR